MQIDFSEYQVLRQELVDILRGGTEEHGAEELADCIEAGPMDSLTASAWFLELMEAYVFNISQPEGEWPFEARSEAEAFLLHFDDALPHLTGAPE